VSPPQPNRGLGSVAYAPQLEKYITGDKDFGNKDRYSQNDVSIID